MEGHRRLSKMMIGVATPLPAAHSHSPEGQRLRL
jgi:hypothetical protein